MRELKSGEGKQLVWGYLARKWVIQDQSRGPLHPPSIPQHLGHAASGRWTQNLWLQWRPMSQQHACCPPLLQAARFSQEGTECTFPKRLPDFYICVSTVLSARCFQIEFQSILRKPCKAGLVTLVLYLRKLRLGDMKSLIQAHRAPVWQNLREQHSVFLLGPPAFKEVALSTMLSCGRPSVCPSARDLVAAFIMHTTHACTHTLHSACVPAHPGFFQTKNLRDNSAFKPSFMCLNGQYEQ